MARKGKVLIDREACKGCYLCIRACPGKVLQKDSSPNADGTYPSKAVDAEKCTACGNCFEVCPDVCIEIYALEESPE
ncbi:MAG: 4Fe-4S binding protein [Spirochaetaceae bacterium]|jgi:2-oxoglutarate ferredoxin oxidoreductase subunit delta|nr:4Fe-4S binding protein [Spirochaetaceae bacterium]